MLGSATAFLFNLVAAATRTPYGLVPGDATEETGRRVEAYIALRDAAEEQKEIDTAYVNCSVQSPRGGVERSQEVTMASELMNLAIERAQADGYRKGLALNYLTPEERAHHEATKTPIVDSGNLFRGFYEDAVKHFGGPVRKAVCRGEVGRSATSLWCAK